MRFRTPQAPWMKGIDPASGHPYYYNEYSNETSWEHPSDAYYIDMFRKKKAEAEAAKLVNEGYANDEYYSLNTSHENTATDEAWGDKAGKEPHQSRHATSSEAWGESRSNVQTLEVFYPRVTCFHHYNPRTLIQRQRRVHRWRTALRSRSFVNS